MPKPARIALCSVDECSYVGRLRQGRCPRHYQAWYASDDFTPRVTRKSADFTILCSIENCERSGQLKRGMCERHYQQWWKQHKYAPSQFTVDGNKICRWCKEAKPLSSFNRTNTKHGYHSRCKECINAYSREWRAKSAQNDPDYALKAWYRSPEYKRQTYLATGWNHFLKKRYKLTAEEFQAKLEAQGGGCAICGRKDSGVSGRQMSVDHCHKTGVIRGILCHPCNRGIGQLGDDPDRLLSASAYLLQYRDVLIM